MKLFFKHNFFPFARFIVVDHSMEPEYKPGDHVLTFNWGKYNKADVIVFIEYRHPGGNVVTDRISDEILRSSSSDNRNTDLRISGLDSIAGFTPNKNEILRSSTSLRTQNDRGEGLQNDKEGKKHKYLIKRIDKIESQLVFVSGDNAERSFKVGLIRLDQIVGKVILKY